MKKPSVFEYLDIVTFLRDDFAYRKSVAPNFSYEAWASELGFQSRSYVRMILLGKKKISDNFAEYYIKACRMNSKEAEYFLILLKYSQTGRLEERQVYGEKLMQILRSVSQREIINPSAEFYSRTLYSRLLTLLGFKDIQTSVSSLSEILVVDPMEVQKALELLEQLGLAAANEHQGVRVWQTALGKYTVPSQIGSADLMKYHEGSLMEAIQAFPQSKENRYYKSLLVPLSPEEVDQLKQLVETFCSEQLTRFQSSYLAQRRLFQVNLNYYAVSQPLADTIVESDVSLSEEKCRNFRQLS
ncbi:hypothetical protein AZI86_16330 [Bdellovibrio bacteriovorus]|uniref:DUF4423 domain-containing protein n=1 Tax=Bdellovibrio bacteriovorus TaxID=959 RepID=A0A150WGV0_BDEBC|nr:TIGR02147 family protein [Bdellovibrio bacteriovorus]KYG62402.1 hypothetical protein AZI86_16330 [Bdellovibrio bacteriovorus]